MIFKDYKLQVDTILDLKNKGWDATRITYYIMVDSMRWSFSRLNSWYDGCRYCWFQNYVLKRRDGINNPFAEYGLIMHEILEKYLADELSIMELEDEFEKGFAKLGDFPPNQYVDLKTTYYKSGIKYLNNPDLPSVYEVVEIEKEVKTKIGKYEFVGYIDLVIRHKKSGKIAL